MHRFLKRKSLFKRRSKFEFYDWWRMPNGSIRGESCSPQFMSLSCTCLTVNLLVLITFKWSSNSIAIPRISLSDLALKLKLRTRQTKSSSVSLAVNHTRRLRLISKFINSGPPNACLCKHVCVLGPFGPIKWPKETSWLKPNQMTAELFISIVFAVPIACKLQQSLNSKNHLVAISLKIVLGWTV